MNDDIEKAINISKKYEVNYETQSGKYKSSRHECYYSALDMAKLKNEKLLESLPSDVRFKHITESLKLINNIIEEKLNSLEGDEYEDLFFARKDLSELWDCINKLKNEKRI